MYPPPPRATEIVKLDWKVVPYKNGKVRIFDGFKERFQNEKFDFILVDAPLGADMKEHSRVDILGIMPQCLEDDFAMLVDDTDRQGEQNTIAEACKMLGESDIPFCTATYRSIKNSTVICAERLRFLTWL